MLIKMKKLEFFVDLYEDRDVGIFGGRVPINIEIPEDIYEHLIKNKYLIKDLREMCLDIIDPDGICLTKAEVDEEYAYLKELEVARGEG